MALDFLCALINWRNYVDGIRFYFVICATAALVMIMVLDWINTATFSDFEICVIESESEICFFSSKLYITNYI